MIKKTITITSLAILVAAISVATTMTMVQANTTDDFVDINIPTADDTDINVQVGGGIEQSTTMQVIDAVVTFTDVDGFPFSVQLGELAITTPGTGIVSGGIFTFTGFAPATVLFTDADADQIVDPGELLVTNPGLFVINGPATLVATSVHPITVDIDGGAETVEIDLTAGSPDTNNIVVTIDDVDWDGETGAIGSFACSSSVGATSTPLFDENTLEVTISGVTIGTTIDIICEFVGFHGDIEKTDTTPNCGPIGIKETFETPCSFNISYTGSTAIIRDTVPAEWRVVSVDNDEETCGFDEANKGKKLNKSATKIECVDVVDVDSDFEVETRKSPSGKEKFKPTECGTFFLNDGAVAFLSDEDGNIVIGTLDGLPIVLDSTAALPVTADDSGLFGCDGELKD